MKKSPILVIFALVLTLAAFGCSSMAPSISEAHTPLKASFADELPSELAERRTVILTDDEYSTEIAFVGAGQRELRLLKLTPTDIDGKEAYISEPLHDCGRLDEGAALVVRLTFYGDLPSWGISYVDEHGETRYFAISLSGEDGSVILHEFRLAADNAELIVPHSDK